MSRISFWVLVGFTIVAVTVGVWYYVRDDYPFQVNSTEIVGLAYRTTARDGTVTGYVTRPPAELADWISAMEQDSAQQTAPLTSVVTVVLAGGRGLRLNVDLGSQLGNAWWLSPDGTTTAPIGIHLSQAFVWYLRGVAAGLAAPGRQLEASPSPAASPSPTPSP
jgi:hypothetical protein